MIDLQKLQAACEAFGIKSQVYDSVIYIFDGEPPFEPRWDGASEDGSVLVVLLDALDRKGWKYVKFRSVEDGFLVDARFSWESYTTHVQGGGRTRTEAVAAAVIFVHEGFLDKASR